MFLQIRTSNEQTSNAHEERDLRQTLIQNVGQRANIDTDIVSSYQRLAPHTATRLDSAMHSFLSGMYFHSDTAEGVHVGAVYIKSTVDFITWRFTRRMTFP